MLTITAATWLFALGAGFGLLLTWLARGVAMRVGLVDSPDRQRKIQDRPIPVAGGVAMLIAAVVSLLITAIAFPDVRSGLTDFGRQAISLFLAAIVITGVGLVDDRYNLRARYKLLGQLAAVMILIIGGGFKFQVLCLLGIEVELGILAGPCTAVWLLACINALNLLDGMDGLLGTVGGIALLSLALIAAMTGHLFASVVALALAGAVLGFLWWNLPPATIYMGDAGSMLIGLVVGAVAIPAALKGPATIALGAPLAILVLPMFDTVAAVIRRKLTGRGLATADRGHLHHVLMRNGLTTRRVLVIVGVLGLVAAGGALATTALRNDLYALVAGTGVIVALVAGKLFGNAELRLIHKRASAAFRAIWPGEKNNRPWELAIRLQGVADWDLVWEDLTGVAYRLNFQTICLDVNAPAMHENYHARWDRPGGPAEQYLWRLEIPLFINKLPIGRLAVAAERDDQSLTDALMVLTKIVEVAEIRVAEVTGSKESIALLPPAEPASPPVIAPEPIIPVRA